MTRLRKTHRIKWSTTKSKYKQGLFIPDNKGKYMGNINNIKFRSSWELKVFEFCDDNRHILKWSSEEIAIPYQKPVFNSKQFKWANYYPDVYVEYLNSSGGIVKEMIEIKPLKQTRHSKARKQSTKIYENATFLVNQMKWLAAEKWCHARNIRFKIMTENDI